MSGKTDSNAFARPKSSSQLAPRKKRVSDAWVGGQSKSPTELSLKKPSNDLVISIAPKIPTEKYESTSKLLETSLKHYENSSKTSTKLEKKSGTLMSIPEATPEIQSRTPESTPESSLKISQILGQSLTKSPEKSNLSSSKTLMSFKNPLELSDSLVNLSNPSLNLDFQSTDESSIRNVDKPTRPNLPLSPKALSSSIDNKNIFLSSSTSRVSIAEPKANIPHTSRPAFNNPTAQKVNSNVPSKSSKISPSRYGSRNSYDLEDEKMEILKEKQNNWPWAYRLTDKYSPSAEHRKFSGSDDIQSMSLTLPFQNSVIEENPPVQAFKSISQKSALIKANAEKIPSKAIKNDTEQEKPKENVQKPILEVKKDERVLKTEDKTNSLLKEIESLKVEIDSFKIILKNNTEKHQTEVKNYSKEILLKDKKIAELIAVIKKNSDLQTEYKRKLEDMERKAKDNGSDSKRIMTRQGTRELDGLNSQIKEFKGMVDELEKDKIKQYEDSNRIIAGYDEAIREKDNIIKKLEKCINAKDRQLTECNETIVKLEVKINELKRSRNSSESPTQDKNIQEKLNSCYKANSELTASLHKEATEKETLIKRLEINNKFHKEEVSKLRTEIERLRKMIKEKCDEKRIEDYEREKKIMQDRIDNLTEMVRIKDEILNRREGKVGNRVYKN